MPGRDVERRRADEALHVRVEPAGQAGEQRRRARRSRAACGRCRCRGFPAIATPPRRLRMARPCRESSRLWRQQHGAAEQRSRSGSRSVRAARARRAERDRRDAGHARCGGRARRDCRTGNRSTRPQAMVLSGRKCPPSRSVTAPRTSRPAPVSSEREQQARATARRRAPRCSQAVA